jgi:glycosyltransferase involved in cell wall biosynthesis
MDRSADPLGDVAALGRLVRVMRGIRPHIVNAGTTKAGLLGMLAARIVGVPVRIYLLRGLRLETTAGMWRGALGVAERLASACATRVLCVSESLRRLYETSGYAPASKLAVIGSGSSNGVDVEGFSPTDSLRKQAAALRAQLKIPAEALVIGFVGRLVRDKGILELLDAFSSVRIAFPDAVLLIVGGDLAGDRSDAVIESRLRSSGRVVLAGQVAEPAAYYGAMDVVAFPSRREGFPNVPLEAAAAGLAVAGFRVTGVVDAVEDGRTGTLVPKGDAAALAESLKRYLADPGLRSAHGTAGQRRVRELFSRERVWRAWAGAYLEELSLKRLPLPAIPPVCQG